MSWVHWFLWATVGINVWASYNAIRASRRLDKARDELDRALKTFLLNVRDHDDPRPVRSD